MTKEAMFYQKKEKKVLCQLCPHQCLIPDGERGLCQVRENREGILYSLNFNRLIATHVDPVEKKPLFHFYPGSRSYSIAASGCNFRCLHCQNWNISQVQGGLVIEGKLTTPEEVIQEALHNHCLSISYTYTEPTIYYETAHSICQIAHEVNLKNIFVTNGYIQSEPLKKIAPYLDAVNIDLKAMSGSFYQKICGAKLRPVLERIKLYYDLGIWIEITTLIIPGYNDSRVELEKIAEFIAGIDQNIPWHISAFYPAYQLNKIAPTPLSVLEEAGFIGKEKGLHFIYLGNVGKGEETYCPSCGRLLVERRYFSVINKTENGKCPFCGERIPGKFNGSIER